MFKSKRNNYSCYYLNIDRGLAVNKKIFEKFYSKGLEYNQDKLFNFKQTTKSNSCINLNSNNNNNNSNNLLKLQTSFKISNLILISILFLFLFKYFDLNYFYFSFLNILNKLIAFDTPETILF